MEGLQWGRRLFRTQPRVWMCLPPLGVAVINTNSPINNSDHKEPSGGGDNHLKRSLFFPMTESSEKKAGEGREEEHLEQRHAVCVCVCVALLFNFNISEACESYFTQWPRKNDKRFHLFCRD